LLVQLFLIHFALCWPLSLASQALERRRAAARRAAAVRRRRDV
jgi:hypothetical protein